MWIHEICERGFAGIHEDSQDFGRGFMGIRETLGEDLWGFGICENIHEESLGEDLWGFVRIHARLWERIHKDSRDFGRGFVGIHETFGEDLLGFPRIHKTLGEDL